MSHITLDLTSFWSRPTTVRLSDICPTLVNTDKPWSTVGPYTDRGSTLASTDRTVWTVQA